MNTPRITDLKFLTAEEQRDAFRQARKALGSLLVQGRLTRVGHRELLTMLNTIDTVWYTQQADNNGNPRAEVEAL